MHATSLRLIRRTSTIVGTILAGVMLLASGPARAAQLVDPHTLNPPPPDSFNATCYRDGSHITCDLAFSDPDIAGEPSGIVCNGTELLFSQTRAVVGKRFYDAAGNLVERHFREDLTGTFTNPVTGKVAFWGQHDTVVHNLTVPGDLSTGSVKTSGLEMRIWVPGSGTVLTDSGLLIVDNATGDELRLSAHHPIDDYFVRGDAAAVAPLCAALS